MTQGRSLRLFLVDGAPSGREHWKIEGTGQTYAGWQDQQAATGDNDPAISHDPEGLGENR